MQVQITQCPDNLRDPHDLEAAMEAVTGDRVVQLRGDVFLLVKANRAHLDKLEGLGIKARQLT